MNWPPDYKEEFERRLKNYNVMLGDEEARQRIMRYYADNPIDWINDWCVTFDPRNRAPLPKVMPFVLFPRQREFILFLKSCLDDRECGLVEKCRDVGATWLCCAFSVWLWLFHSGSTVGWGSLLAHSIDDRGNPKAIFLKIRQIIEYLPAFMLPPGFDMRAHAPLMKILHPADTATIIGEGGDNVGRGGRTTIYFKDESAHYEHPEMIEAALGDNTDVQIDISSVHGANVFYHRRMAGEEWAPGRVMTKGMVRVFIFDWRDHPAKSQEWHDLREAKFRREGLYHVFAQEVERDYLASVDRIIIRPEWVRAAIDAHIALNFGDSGQCIAGQDVADGGGDKNALAIVKGVVLRYADHWGGEAGEAPKVAVPACIDHGCQELYYDSIGVGAGFKTGINNMVIPAHLRVMPWNAGADPIDPTEHVIPGDPQSPTNEEQYKNLKAQGWFRLRTRFYKTFRAVVHKEKFDPSELISLDSKLERLNNIQIELCQAVHKYSTDGKTLVDKKPEGALSPNLADAIVIAYNPTREVSIFDSM